MASMRRSYPNCLLLGTWERVSYYTEKRGLHPVGRRAGKESYEILRGGASLLMREF